MIWLLGLSSTFSHYVPHPILHSDSTVWLVGSKRATSTLPTSRHGGPLPGCSGVLFLSHLANMCFSFKIQLRVTFLKKSFLNLAPADSLHLHLTVLLVLRCRVCVPHGFQAELQGAHLHLLIFVFLRPSTTPGT